MKRFISAALSTAVALSCLSTGVYAEAVSESYTIDTQTKIISKVAPLTKVSAFKNNITGAEVEVVNVDGTAMDDGAYATENVFAKIDGELYGIDVEYAYAPIKNDGSALSDGTAIYDKKADEADFMSLAGGFTKLQTYAKFGYGADNPAPVNTGTQTVKAAKQTKNGEAVYVLENDSNNYAYLRSHYSASANYSTALNSAINTWSTGPIVTTVEFEADKLGNISLFNNTPVRDGNKNITKGDSETDGLIYSVELPYAANSVHFLEDGSVKLGGTYTNQLKDYRSPIQETDFQWEPGKKYTVSVVQRYLRGAREAYVDGVYVNGEKIFPNIRTAGHSDGRVALQADGTFKIGTKSSSVTHGGGLSSVMIGTAPKNADENLTVYLSDVNVYGLQKSSDFDPAITKQNISLSDAQDVTVTENNGENKPALSDTAVETVKQLKDKYPDIIMGIYNADGALANDTDYLKTGMKAKIASADGLQGKTYEITAAKSVSETVPESNVYTVDTDKKVISNVKPLTTVSAFLADFENGSMMKVVNIDGSEMSTDAFATENVSLKAPNGDIYKINVQYAYSPVQTNGDELSDGTAIYDMAANEINNTDLTSGGFVKLQQYAKIGYGSDNTAPENTENQTVRAEKQTENGDIVYVMENDSNNYAYIRSHYTESANYSTTLNSAIDSWTEKPIVTSVEFEADRLGNISVFNNTPVRDGNKAVTKGDSGIDALVYGVELPFVPNSVHFLDDGSVKLGGMYSNYTSGYRNPSQETNFKWQPGKKYTVSIVQRYLRGKREAYVDGVYINGEKVFPNEKTANHSDGRVALQPDGTFKIGTRSNSVTHGGGLSSVMIGTAPKAPGENLKVSLSDVKVYSADAYNASKDADIVLKSKNSTVFVDNDNEIIKCVGSISADNFETSAKLKVESGYLKAVSQDGLKAKTYTIVRENIQKDFFNAAGEIIGNLSDADSSVTFGVNIDSSSLIDNTAPVVVAAVYDKQKNLKECVVSDGIKYSNEVTSYKAVIDISEYNKDDIEIRGFVWSGFESMKPFETVSELK